MKSDSCMQACTAARVCKLSMFNHLERVCPSHWLSDFQASEQASASGGAGLGHSGLQSCAAAE